MCTDVTPTYNRGHPRPLHRHLFHYNTLTQTQDLQDLGLTSDSRVKTILNPLDLFLHSGLSHHFTLHRERCWHKRHTCSVFSLSLLLWKNSSPAAAPGTSAAPFSLLCYFHAEAFAEQIYFPSCIKPLTTQSHDIWCTLESHTWSIRWATKSQHSTPVFLH